MKGLAAMILFVSSLAHGYTSQATFWAYTDFSVGLVVGSYTKMILFSRNNDCFSNTLNLSTFLVNYHMLADHEIGNHTIGKAMWYSSIAITTSHVYSWVDACTLQLNEEVQTQWYSRYNTMLKELPQVKSTSSTTTARIFNWLKVGAHLLDSLKFWKS